MAAAALVPPLGLTAAASGPLQSASATQLDTSDASATQLAAIVESSDYAIVAKSL